MDRSLYEDINGYAAAHTGIAHVADFLAVDAIFLFVAVLAFLTLAPERWTGGQGRPAVVRAQAVSSETSDKPEAGDSSDPSESSTPAGAAYEVDVLKGSEQLKVYVGKDFNVLSVVHDE